MKTTFEFKGGREIEAALRELGKPLHARRAAERALPAGLEPVAVRARALVPKDELYLEHSIKVGKRADTRGTRKFKRGAGKDLVELYVGIDTSAAGGDTSEADLAVYSVVQEEGSPAKNIPAQPYMRPAMDSELPGAPDRVRPALWEEIAKIAARLAARAKRG
jgi:hypothetical protein